jgi:flavin reductase (DIM6/NTAB) family NADH-FMN oxidoreductase RutF
MASELNKENQLYKSPDPNSKVEVEANLTNNLMTVHSVILVTTAGERVNKDGEVEKICGISPFGANVDTSYGTTGDGVPQVMIAITARAHSAVGGPVLEGEPNTLINIRQNGLFIANIPGRDLIGVMDKVAYPFSREDYIDKIEWAGLTKLEPFGLPDPKRYAPLNARLGSDLRRPNIYPPILGEGLAHLECVVEPGNIIRPSGSDHHLVIGTVIAASYDTRLGRNINKAKDDKETKEILNEIQDSLVDAGFDHFGGRTKDGIVVRNYASHKRFYEPTDLIFQAEVHEPSK